MPECECLKKCPFFNDHMQGLEAVASMLKTRLCKGDNQECARYMIFKTLGREHVPSNLSPNDPERVKKILEENNY